VTLVFLGRDFISVTKEERTQWDQVTPGIFSAIEEFFLSGPRDERGDLIFVESSLGDGMNTEINDDDDEITATIKELLDTRIRSHNNSDDFGTLAEQKRP